MLQNIVFSSRYATRGMIMTQGIYEIRSNVKIARDVYEMKLKGQGAMDRYEEVLQEIPRVRKDLGYPPLVTPLSQMVGTQAVMNVLAGERYKMVPKEINDYLKGLYGQAPAPVN